MFWNITKRRQGSGRSMGNPCRTWLDIRRASADPRDRFLNVFTTLGLVTRSDEAGAAAETCVQYPREHGTTLPKRRFAQSSGSLSVSRVRSMHLAAGLPLLLGSAGGVWERDLVACAQEGGQRVSSVPGRILHAVCTQSAVGAHRTRATSSASCGRGRGGPGAAMCQGGRVGL